MGKILKKDLIKRLGPKALVKRLGEQDYLIKRFGPKAVVTRFDPKDLVQNELVKRFGENNLRKIIAHF